MLPDGNVQIKVQRMQSVIIVNVQKFHTSLTKVSDKMAYANSAGPGQTAPVRGV